MVMIQVVIQYNIVWSRKTLSCTIPLPSHPLDYAIFVYTLFVELIVIYYQTPTASYATDKIYDQLSRTTVLTSMISLKLAQMGREVRTSILQPITLVIARECSRTLMEQFGTPTHLYL
jgi:hypothetical protein